MHDFPVGDQRSSLNGVMMRLPHWTARIPVYWRLMRADRPIGFFLLLWPTLWALWFAADGLPPWRILVVFIAGSWLMRAAGCVVNDYADRAFDGHVKRTSDRPLPSGLVTKKEVCGLFTVLSVLSFSLVLTLNVETIALSVAAFALACSYPFAKRYTNFPQVVLGAAFGWSIPMAYASLRDSLPLECWVLFLANLLWTVSYDTQYAMVDRDDDVRIGLKSTAILFGRHDRVAIGALQSATLVLLALLNRTVIGFCSLLAAAVLFAYQQKLIARRDRSGCFKAFLNNNHVGWILFVGIALSR
jgi:4-hydroxybenzoate polyprenyltransferase